jgi:hypothetical protein
MLIVSRLLLVVSRLMFLIAAIVCLDGSNGETQQSQYYVDGFKLRGETMPTHWDKGWEPVPNLAYAYDAIGLISLALALSPVPASCMRQRDNKA